MSVVREESIHMIMDAAGFTKMVQGYVLDGEPSKANYALDGVIGLSDKERKAVLAGDGVFLGNTLCDDDGCKQCKKLRDGGNFRFSPTPDEKYKDMLEDSGLDRTTIGGYDVPTKLLNEYVNFVRSIRSSMTLASFHGGLDPLRELKRQQAREDHHREIFKAIGLPYHGDASTDATHGRGRESLEFQDALSKYVDNAVQSMDD